MKHIRELVIDFLNSLTLKEKYALLIDGEDFYESLNYFDDDCKLNEELLTANINEFLEDDNKGLIESLLCRMDFLDVIDSSREDIRIISLLGYIFYESNIDGELVDGDIEFLYAYAKKFNLPTDDVDEIKEVFE